MAITALSPMDVKATGKGNHTNSTTATSLVALTTMVSQISLGKGAQNHSSQTTPITRQPIRHRYTKYSAPFSLTHTQPRRSARSGPRPTSVAPLPNKVKRRGQPSRSTTGRSKGSYPTRAVTINDTLSPSTVGGSAYNSKTSRRTRKSQKSSTRKGKWRERTKHYLHPFNWRDDGELASEFLSQTEQPPKSTLPATPELTPSLVTEPTVSSPVTPTPCTAPDQGEQTDQPQCPPRIERPTLTLTTVDSQATLHMKLENTPAFISQCQPKVWLMGSSTTVPINATGDNNRLQIPGVLPSQRWFADGSRVIYLATVTFCRTNPAQHQYSYWNIYISAGNTVYQQSSPYREDSSSLSRPSQMFETWYVDRSDYQQQTCADKYGKMQFQLLYVSRCPIELPGNGFLYLDILRPLEVKNTGVNRACFSEDFAQDQPTQITLNGRRADFHICGHRASIESVCGALRFRVPIQLPLNRHNLRDYRLWDHGYLTISLARNTTGGAQEQANITLPIQKRPDVESVQLDHHSQQLTIQLGNRRAEYLAVVVTIAPLPAAQNRTNDTVDDSDQPTTARGQTFVCSPPDRTLAVPLAELAPDQPGTVLIALVPDWHLRANFSLVNPKDRATIEQAEHLVAYHGEQRIVDDGYITRRGTEVLPVKPCIGHCQTCLLPAALANVGNTTIGSCHRPTDQESGPTTAPLPHSPSSDNPSPESPPTGSARQSAPVLLIAIPMVILLNHASL